MGALSHITVTGAAGFIGRAVVAEARRRGHDVTAVVRGAAPAGWSDDAGVTVLSCDLSDPGAVETLRDGIAGGVVIHAAASLFGTPMQMQADTLRATRHLLAAMRAVGGGRLVLVSSIAVYDTQAIAIGGTLDESCPVLDPAEATGAYATAKAQQERIARDEAEAAGIELSILRPGAVFGPDRLWNGHLGAALGPVLLRVGSAGEIPVCHVGHCARALVDAAVAPGPVCVNVIDDDRPTRARYIAALRAQGWPRVVIPLPWQILLPLGGVLAPVRAWLPGLLKPAVLRARMTPLTYDNSRLHAALGFEQSASFEALMAGSVS